MCRWNSSSVEPGKCSKMKALQPKFLLDRPNQEDYTYIMCCLNYKNVRMKVATGDYILPGHWDKETQRPTTERRIVRNFTPIQNKEMRMITHHLDDIEFFVKDQLVDMRSERNVDLHVLKDRILEFLGRKKEDKKITKLTDFADNAIERMKTGELLTAKSLVYSTSSIYNFVAVVAYIKEFEKTNGVIYFEEVDSKLIPSFIQFCNSKGRRQNTTSLYVSLVRQLFVIAKRENIFFNEAVFDSSAPRFIPVDTISLTKEELQRIASLSLPKHLEKARDLFLIGCYTLLRFSDYSAIKPENIRNTENGVRVIDSINQKTKKRSVVPFLFPELDPLLVKYDYTAPRMSAQKIGIYIKEVAKLADINSPVTFTETASGITKKVTLPKHELVTTHTARRTGATILYKSGYPLSSIMKLLAHSTEAMTLKYLKVSLDENAELMMELPFA